MTLNELFTNIADAIRLKRNSTKKIVAADFPNEINEILDVNDYFEGSIAGQELEYSPIYKNITHAGTLTVKSESCQYLFCGCEKLKTIEILDTSNVTNFNGMFKNCISLEAIPLLDTSKGDIFNRMFQKCENLETIPLLDTSNAIDLFGMFGTCSKFLYLPALNTSKVNEFRYMFSNCTSLKTVPELDASNCTAVLGMFQNCTNLENLGGLLNLGKSYTKESINNNNYILQLSYSTSITYESLINIINKVYDLNLSYDVANGGTLYSQKMILGTDNINKLTSEEIAIATAKGWNVS